MSPEKQKMGNPLAEAAQTGMLGRKPIGSKETPAPTQEKEKEPEAKQDEGKTTSTDRIKGTLLFTPARKKWLKVRAAQEDREMSDIAEEAFSLYEKLNPLK